MPESFGARLRQQREARQIDLVAISEQTKIKLALLDALEHDDVSHWPSGIFRRAYIRAYAQFIGLDPDAILREFLEVHPDPGDSIVASAAGAAAAEEEYAKHAPSMRFRNIVGSALGSLTRLRRPGGEERRSIVRTDDVHTSSEARAGQVEGSNAIEIRGRTSDAPRCWMLHSGPSRRSRTASRRLRRGSRMWSGTERRAWSEGADVDAEPAVEVTRSDRPPRAAPPQPELPPAIVAAAANAAANQAASTITTSRSRRSHGSAPSSVAWSSAAPCESCFSSRLTR